MMKQGSAEIQLEWLVKTTAKPLNFSVSGGTLSLWHLCSERAGTGVC